MNDDRMIARGRHEADYSVEGMGSRQMDPLEEYRLEEERLRNLKSPYGENTTEPRMVVRPSGKHPYVKGKPPTPPPRERSRTPPSPRRMSPVGRKGAPASQQYGRQTPTEVPFPFFSPVSVNDPPSPFTDDALSRTCLTKAPSGAQFRTTSYLYRLQTLTK